MDHVAMNGKTILIIDDDISLCQILDITFTVEGAMVITANDGREGLQKFFAHRPPLVVLDVNMLHMDGWETCTRIKCDAITADIPVILLTGADDRDLTQHANAVGASALLQKPCPAERLRAAIVSVLDRAAISKR